MIANVTGKDFFNQLVSSVTAFLARGLQHFFGNGIYQSVFGNICRADLIVALIPILFVVLLNIVLAIVFRRQADKAQPHHLRKHLFDRIGGPVFLFLWIGGVYLGIAPLLLKLWSGDLLKQIESVLDKIFSAAIFIGLLWLCFRVAQIVEARLTVWAQKIPGRAAKFVVPLFGRSLRVMLPVLVIVFALPIFFTSKYEPVFDRVSSVLIILAVACILFEAVDLGQKALLAEYDLKVADNLQARKIYTQSRLISRTLHVVIAFCTVASVLMLFQTVRHVGTSMLASAGIVGIIAGIAGQKTLANCLPAFRLRWRNRCGRTTL